MKKRRYRHRQGQPRNYVVSACNAFVNRLNYRIGDEDLFDKLAEQANQKGYVLHVDQHTQGWSMRFIKRDELIKAQSDA